MPLLMTPKNPFAIHARLRFYILAIAILVLALATGVAPAHALQVERVRSPGGIEAWLVRDHTNPIISVRFAFLGGASLDPAGKEGLANMTSALLDEGAGEWDSQAFQGLLSDLAISLRFDASRDVFGGKLKMLTRNRDKAFELLTQALIQPRFDDEPVGRIRAQLLSGLRRGSEDPDEIASRTLSRTLFPGHPYGRPVRGTVESITAMTAGDLRTFVANRLARDNLVIGVVGDISAEDLAPILDQVFGKLPENAAPWKIPEVEPSAEGKTIVVKKAVPQSSIVFAQPGVKRNDPDFYAAYILNHILGGGGFTSRLYDEVRDKRGLAYSIYSSLYPLDYSSMIIGGAGTANARAAETVRLVRQEWKRLATGGVTAEELADAKTYLTGSYPLRFTSSSFIAAILVGIQMDDLGIDYIDKRNGYVEAVTLQQVNRLAADLIDAEKLTMVVVGEPQGLEGSE